MKHYHHLSSEERAYLMLAEQNGTTIRAIARSLNRSPSTISRELQRHRTSPKQRYCATAAAQNYVQNRKASVRPRKLDLHRLLSCLVNHCLLDKQWSPEQISGTLKCEYAGQSAMQVSPETIYAFIYAQPKGELRKMLVQALRRKKSKRGPRGSKNSNYSSLKMTAEQLIINRPQAINERLYAGHWEGDLIVGAKNQSCVGTLVDRQTGFLVLSKMQSKSALDVRLGFEQQMTKLPGFLRLSMTYDRGAEMAQHPIMSENLQMRVYFADPHAPWQRGSNENINGLIRQYLPKGTDLSVHSQSDLNDIAWLLNTRPRKRFGFMTPQAKMNEVITDFFSSVALDS
jgi:IS30 family transposase